MPFFTDHNSNFAIGAPPALAAAVAIEIDTQGRRWISNSQLIALDNNLGSVNFETAETQHFFVFDALYQRRSSVQEIKNPSSLNNSAGSASTFNLGVLSSWQGWIDSPPNSEYWHTLCYSGIEIDTRRPQLWLNRRDTTLAAAMLAPMDRNDLLAFILMNMMRWIATVTPTPVVTYQGIALVPLMAADGTALPILSGSDGCGWNSSILLGRRRRTEIATARAICTGLGISMIP